MALASSVIRVEGPYRNKDFTISDTYNVSGSSIMALSGSRTVVKSSDAANPESMIGAGIASTDKEAGDGRLNIGCSVTGSYSVVNGGAATIGAGDSVSLSGSNTVSGCGAVKSIYTCGRAMQSITVGASGEVEFEFMGA